MHAAIPCHGIAASLFRTRGELAEPFFTCYRPFAMVLLAHILPYVQIALSALLVVSVLMQRTGATLGGAFGADNFSSGFHTRRGAEKFLFQSTIVLGVLFALSAFVSLLIH